jgi:phenylacetate-coenzyme A ligase PaaK-like adenylate-forming protein
MSINIRECTWDFVSVFQLVQNTAGELIIRLVPNKNYTEAIKEQLLNNVRQAYGEFFDVKLEVVGEIPRTKTGKRRSIVCNLESR